MAWGLPARMEAVENRLAGVEDRLANLAKKPLLS